MKYIPCYRKAYKKARYKRMLARHTVYIDLSDCCKLSV